MITITRFLRPICVLLLSVATTPTTGAPQLGPNTNQLRVAPIVLRPHGFEPADIEIRSGKALVAVYNRTGLTEVHLSLERQVGGERLREQTLGSGRRHWKLDIELAPGKYLIRETKHQSWICHLTVTAAN
ncbi:MAG: hypothetical protein DMG07_04925 [Acidobacteria bacterium]|nr:MAG: hypothetical protein DMG07_04925 [Acidobacteriota bacterium]